MRRLRGLLSVVTPVCLMFLYAGVLIAAGTVSLVRGTEPDDDY